MAIGMEKKTMGNKKSSERPEVYALRQEGGDWQISRRDFLKAAGIGAAAISAGLSGCSPKEKEEDLVQITATPVSLSDLCLTAPAHDQSVETMALSVDGKYLITGASNKLKCWDVETNALLGTQGRLPFPSYFDAPVYAAGLIGGKSCVFGNGNGTDYIQYFELPFTNDSEKQNLPVKGKYIDLAMDPAGNFYGIRNDGIYYSSAADGYASTDLIYELDGSNYTKSIRLIDEDRKLFVQFGQNREYGVLDLTDKTMKKFEGICYRFALTPDGSRALIYDNETNDIRNISLEDGSVRWTENGEQMGYIGRYGSQRIKGIAVSADGNHAFFFGDTGQTKGVVRMHSMADGSFEKSLVLGSFNNQTIQVVLTKDGTKLITVYGSGILIISLPDLTITGCLSDVNAMTDKMEGIELSRNDPVTGVVYTYTLPAGAEIPADAVCICNTVTGKISTACTCDSYKCSCDAHRSGGGSHYWHPN